MIPKVIHYCWFGGNPLPNIAVKCINSWKKYFPDYEIIEWNESNFDLFSCDYCREAYDAKKWAFVSDFDVRGSDDDFLTLAVWRYFTDEIL